MNRQLFLQLLEHPDSFSEQENIALKKFTEDFPYCQTGRLLFVKHLHSQKSVHYPEQLKIAAAYAADRKVLYNLIHTASPLAPLQRRGKYSEEDVIQIPEVIIEEKKMPEITDEQIPQPETFSLREELAEKSSSAAPAEIISEKKIIEESKTPSDIIQKRLQEIAALKTTTSVPEVQPEKKEELKGEPISVKEEPSFQAQEIIQPKIPEKKKEEEQKSGKHSFTEWLKTVKQVSEAAAPEQEKSVPPVTSTDEIINRFIETEPKIIPSKVEFYSPVKMAKQSLEEHDDLVSETLAGIFAEQGNLPRAIEMYRKLMLSNPEKSSFFAARIEKLTQQLNEGK